MLGTHLATPFFDQHQVENQVLGISDQTIMVVANLIGIEPEAGNMRVFHMHIDSP